MRSGRCSQDTLLRRRDADGRAPWPVREIVNAIFYVMGGGIAWRLLALFVLSFVFTPTVLHR